jgi:hypothetical protein
MHPNPRELMNVSYARMGHYNGLSVLFASGNQTLLPSESFSLLFIF